MNDWKKPPHVLRCGVIRRDKEVSRVRVPTTMSVLLTPDLSHSALWSHTPSRVDIQLLGIFWPRYTELGIFPVLYYDVCVLE
jgi:hypothetical protein